MNFFKRIAAGVTAAVMMLAAGTSAVFASYEESASGEPDGAPEIVITSGKSFEMWANTSAMVPVAFSVRNDQEVEYCVSSLSGGDKYVVVEDLEKRVNNSNGNSGFIVKAAATATAGDYTLTANVAAYSKSGTVLASKSYSVKLTVKSKLQVKGLVIDSYKVSSDAIKPGDSFDIDLTLKNNTGIDVKNAELQIEGLDTTKFVISKGLSKQYVDIAKDKSGTARFSLIAQNGITLEREVIKFSLSYTLDETKSDLSRQTSIDAVLSCVPGVDKATYGAHDLIMSGYTVSRTNIEKGTKFSLTVVLKNTGSKDINKARVTVNADGTKFSVESGLAYRDLNIKKGESKSVTFDLIGGSGIASEREYIPVVIEFGSNSTTMQAVVSCKPKDDKDVGKYDVTMTNYEVSKTGVERDTRFDLTVYIKNSGNKDVDNVHVAVNPDGTKFLVDSGLAYRDFSIKKGETKKVTFKMIGGAGIAAQREYIPVAVEFGSNSSTFQAVVSCKVNEDKDIDKYALIMTRYTVSKTGIEKGTKFDLTVDIKNNGSKDVENARISVNADGTKFLIDTGLAYKDLGIKKGETKSITFKLLGGSGITNEREYIPVVIEFGTNSSTMQAVVSCKSSGSKDAGKYDLSVTDYYVSSDSIAENTVFELSFNITNSSSSDIDRARVTLLNLDGTKFAIDSGLNYRDFDIASGEVKQFSFRLIGCKGLSSIREVIPIQIDHGEVTGTFNATVTCVPKNTDEDSKKVFAPNIIIESYDFGNEYITAGQTFPLKLVIKNVSNKASVENLKVTINGVADHDGKIAFTPANSTNSFFFDDLSIGETKDINIDILPKADAAPNSYPVGITFSYEYAVNDDHYQANPVTETINIPLRQEDRLEINEPEVPAGGVNVGDLCTVSLSIVNKGKSAVYNVTAKVEGEGFTIDNPTYYIGNINSGIEEYYDAKITPTAEGQISGEIVFTYEDSNGESKESRSPFSVNAVSFNMGGDMFMGGGEFTDMAMEEMPQEDSGITSILIIGGVIAVAIVIIIIVVVNVKKKKKKAELEDDDEDI